MNETFRLLVFGIVAAALIWVFLTNFAPLFFPQQNVHAIIQSGLQTAKTKPGTILSLGNLRISEQTILTARAFSEPGTDTVLECNHPSFCCDKGQTCPSKIVWSETQLLGNRNQELAVFVRCKQAFDFFACRIFAGQKPAQLKIQNQAFETTLDLASQTDWEINTTIANAGNQPSQTGFVRLELQKKTGEPDSWQKLAEQQQSLETLLPGATIQIQFSIPIFETGTYRAIVRAESDNAGYEEKTAGFNALNQGGNCTAETNRETETIFDSQTQDCIEKFFCIGCSFAAQCKQEWENAQPQKTFEIGDSTFAQTATPGTIETCN